MGYLQEGSLRVSAGNAVQKGQAIAKVGNSGWTTQPHLHIQSMKVSEGSFWSAEGIPILFDGKNAVKNALFFK
jgi:murein DD-endopeptidase MepM/ murein hydrolase activator NlpD